VHPRNILSARIVKGPRLRRSSRWQKASRGTVHHLHAPTRLFTKKQSSQVLLYLPALPIFTKIQIPWSTCKCSPILYAPMTGCANPYFMHHLFTPRRCPQPAVASTMSCACVALLPEYHDSLTTSYLRRPAAFVLMKSAAKHQSQYRLWGTCAM
jgi:hypothetical protein